MIPEIHMSEFKSGFYDIRLYVKDKNNSIIVKYLQTTVGRVIFNYTIHKILNLL